MFSYTFIGFLAGNGAGLRIREMGRGPGSAAGHAGGLGRATGTRACC